ncbi:hypothetical protein [Stutzerimonas stutzeri]|uniref:hypothetical protein n=1 Tax=Stutzerimonas stutzeri TaxID=316 RepID=UPI0020C6FDFC|nr:hypothetical protein [Stutzerimonas stutzeri]
MQQEIDRQTAQAVIGNRLLEPFRLRSRFAFKIVASPQRWRRAIALHLRERDALRPGLDTKQAACGSFTAFEKQPHRDTNS